MHRVKKIFSALRDLYVVNYELNKTMLGKIILGLVCTGLGFLMVWKPSYFVEFIGEQQWAEKFFGYGRSSTGYQAIGIAVIIIGFLIMTGSIEGILKWIFVR